MSAEKPPLGVMPRWQHDELRQEALFLACERYNDAHKTIPVEWLREYVELAIAHAKRNRGPGYPPQTYDNQLASLDQNRTE